MKVKMRWSEKHSYEELAPSELCVYYYEREEDQRPHYIGIVGKPKSPLSTRYVRSYNHLILATFCAGYRWFVGRLDHRFEDTEIANVRDEGQLFELLRKQLKEVESQLIWELKPVANKEPGRDFGHEIIHLCDVPPSLRGCVRSLELVLY